MKIQELYRSYFTVKKRELPYENDREQLGELFAFLDLCFAVVFSARGKSQRGLPEAWEAGVLPELSVSADDLGALLCPQEERKLRGLKPEAAQEIAMAWEHIGRRRDVSIEQGFVPRFDVLRLKFGLDEFEYFAMLLALSTQYDRKYEGVFARLHNNRADFYASKWLAVRLYECLFQRPAPSLSAVLTGSSPLCRFLCSRGLEQPARSETSHRLVLSPRVTSYLLGDNSPDPLLTDYCKPVNVDRERLIPFRQQEADILLHLLLKKGFRRRGCFVVQLCGPEGVGRTTLAGRAAAVVGYPLLRVELSSLLRSESETEKLLDMIYTETQLLGAIPCFVIDKRPEPAAFDEDAVPAEGNEENEALQRAAARLAGVFRFLFWLCPESDAFFSRTEAEVYRMELPMLTANERLLFWRESLVADEASLRSYANRYLLTPRTIRQAAKLAGVMAAAEGTALEEKHIVAAVRQYSLNQLGAYATRINAVFTWDDLVVSEEQKRRMKMICDQVRFRSVVNEDWGFRRRTPYGRGLCALFYGSPGTGKTMAVQVMANELGLELYRIDLSQLTSKYIGETQKNISRLFDKAKNINAMLFFDEADAMFAKRSEVKDANDRYANADTAFLLQKLEDFEGITILATNYVNNIDDAFKRRIKFMVNFVFPSPEVRLQLWRKILPEDARTDEPLDLEFFAERFELSGSNIKEILTNAAFLAASEGGGIRNRHLIEAVKLNFSKYGKQLTDSDFEYLA